MSVEEQLKWTLQNLSGSDLPSAKVVFKSQAKQWFSVSGTTKQNVFYEHSIKAHGVFATVLFVYPASRTAEINRAVAHIARSLKG